MKTQIIALEAHDDFISVRDRMSWAKAPRILLVWPKFEKITLQAADLRILQKHAQYLGADMGVITRRGDVRRDAQRFGIPVFGSAAAAQRDAWPALRPSASKLPHKLRTPRAELDAMREGARVGEAGWRARPLARIGFFALGVMAVLAIAALFLPQAQITLTPLSQQQSVTLPVTASLSVAVPSIAGGVPAHEITVAISGSQSAHVATQSNIPDARAHGVARFTNLTQSAVTIPAGTVVYSLSPAAVQFATVNNTHLPGNVNAVVEVPITSINGGEAANLPANAIQAIEGNLSLSASVTNLQPTTGGTDRMAAAPSDADRNRLHDVLVGLLKSQAQAQISDSIGAKDLLLVNSLKMGQIAEETFDPPAGKGGNLLKLTMRADFSAQYVKADDLSQLAEGTLNGSKPQGFAPVPGSMSFRPAGLPKLDDAGASHFDLQIERKLVREMDLRHANALIRGLNPQAAAQALQAALPLAGRPEIKLSPAGWPWLPLIPFRITVVSAQ